MRQDGDTNDGVNPEEGVGSDPRPVPLPSLGRLGLRPADLLALQGFADERQRWLSETLKHFDAATPPLAEMLAQVTASMPSLMESLRLAITADMARTLTGPSVLTAVREAMRAQDEVGRLFSSDAFRKALDAQSRVVIPPYTSMLPDIAGQIVVLQQRFLDNTSPVQAPAFAARLQRLNTASVTEWRVMTTTTVDTPTGVVRLVGAGLTTLGLATGTAVLVQPASQPSIEVPAWLMAPTETRGRLLGRLSELDLALPTHLDGAWDRAARGGPDAPSQVAHSLVELMDWSLRLAAPDAMVLGWHHAEERPQSDLYKDRPTRALKVRYLLRAYGPDGPFAAVQVRLIGALFTLLQDEKHALVGESLDAVRLLIPTVEAFLTFVLLAEADAGG